MTAVETAAPFVPSETSVKTRYLVVDTESVPDGELIALTKYPDEALTPAAAIAKAQDEARDVCGRRCDGDRAVLRTER